MKKIKNLILLLFTAAVLIGLPLCAYADEHEHMHHEDTEKNPPKETEAGITEHLGKKIAVDAEFVTSDGRKVKIGGLLTKPTLIAPVYYSCPNVCNFLQSRLAAVVPEMKIKPGEQFNLISVSFDELDTPETAAKKKINYLKAADGKIPAENWIFLTGSKENIKLLMDSIGFRFTRKDKDFAHPVTVAAVAPDGKIVRYLYGTDVLPFEMTMAVLEAEKGTPGISVKKLAAYCFSYDPSGRKYVFNTMRVAGFVVLGVIFIFAAFLFFGGKKRK